jgi:hypothetical protein
LAKRNLFHQKIGVVEKEASYPRPMTDVYPNIRFVMSPIHFHHPFGTYNNVTVMKT